MRIAPTCPEHGVRPSAKPARYGRRTAAALLLVIAAAGLRAAAMAAPAYPDRPIELVVPYTAGGAADTVARLLQPGMARRLGQPVVVVNKPGGNTIVGTEYVAHANPDGYTIAIVSVPHVANFTFLKHMPYAQSDFAPIAQVANTPSVLVVNPSLPVKTLSQFIAYVKARPGRINYSTFGVGSSAYLAGLLFESKIGAKLVSVQYHGGAQAAVAVMTGEVQFEFGTPLSTKAGIDAGKLKALAVAAAKRLPFLPDVPTMKEAGLDLVSGGWFGLLAPAATPRPVVDTLYAAVKTAMADPKLVRVFDQSGTEIVVTPPAQFGRFIAHETKALHTLLSGLSIGTK